MSRIRRLPPPFLVVAMLAMGPSRANAAGHVALLDATDRRVVFEVKPLPATTESVSTTERSYIRITIPGFGATDVAGNPEIPIDGITLAVPPGTIPELRVLEEEWSSSLPGAVVPVPERYGVRETFGTSRVVESEPREGAAYRALPVAPREPFSLGPVAGLRHWQTVQVGFAGAKAEVFTRTYRTLVRAKLEVTFRESDGRARRKSERAVSVDEEWAKTARLTFLNGERAGRYAVAGAGDAGTVGDTPWGAGDQWKILLGPESTMTQITFEALSEAGFPSGISVDHLALYQRGFDLARVDDAGTPASALFVSTPVPCRIVDGGTSGVFGPGDTILFYSRSFRDQWMTSGRENEDAFGQQIYVWLKIDLAGGARMPLVRASGSLSGTAVDSLASTTHTVFVEEDVRYYERAPDTAAGSRAYEAEFYYRNDTQSPTAVNDDPMHGWILQSAAGNFDPVDIVDPVPGTAGTLVLRVSPGGGGTAVANDRNFTTQFEASLNDSTPPRFASKTFYNGNLFSGVIMPPANALHSFPIPGGTLVSGANRLYFTGRTFRGNSTNPANAFTVTRFFFDWFEVTYNRLLQARSGQLRLSTANGPATNLLVRVSGFSGTDLRLFDITNPGTPEEWGVAPSQIVSDGSGFALRFDHDNSTGVRRLLAARGAEIPAIASSRITRIAPSGILTAGIGAKYVALTHDSFLTGAQELAGLRAARMSAIAAPVSAVYDIFNNGMVDPRAIKAYVTYAFHRWGTPPAFLSLIGDANEDHRGVRSESDPDFIPSHSLWASYEGAPEESDQYYAELTRGGFADPDGFDDLADLYVGRLSVGSPEELSWNIERIRDYESPSSESDSWRRHVVLLADDAFSGDLGGGFGQDGYHYQANEVLFRDASDDYADSLLALPFDKLIVDKLYVSDFTMPCPDSCYFVDTLDCENGLGRDCGIFYDCRNADWVQEYTCMRAATRATVLPELRRELNSGALIWNYEGHANKYFLCHEEIFRDDNFGGARDVSTLENEGMPFIFLGFACHLAEFDNVDEETQGDCIAEKLMNVRPVGLDRPGGAIGSFASSGFEFLSPNLLFNADVFEAFFHPERAMQVGTLPDAPGADGVYAWTLGEATTRARLLYQSHYVSPSDTRQAAQRFALLGDPAVTPDVGVPEIRVLVNGAAVANGEFLDLEGSGAQIEIQATVQHGRGIRSARLVDSGRGEIPASEIQVTDTDVTTDGVVRQRTLAHTHPVRPENYDFAVEAVNERGSVSRFAISIRANVEVLDLTSFPNPFEDELRVYYRLTKRADQVRVRIYTLAGREVFESTAAPGDADVNLFSWDGRDNTGNVVANGTYLLHLQAAGASGGSQATTRVVKMR